MVITIYFQKSLIYHFVYVINLKGHITASLPPGSSLLALTLRYLSIVREEIPQKAAHADSTPIY